MRPLYAWLLGIAIGLGASWVLSTSYRGDARFLEARADSLYNLSNALRAQNIADSLEHADSSVVWIARMADADSIIQAVSLDAINATITASAIASTLELSLDSAEAAMFTQFRAEVAVIIASKDVIIQQGNRKIATLAAQNSTLTFQLSSVRMEATTLRAENTALRGAQDALHSEIRSLERQSWYVKLGAAALVTATVIDKVAS